jgi:hypothetical protein
MFLAPYTAFALCVSDEDKCARGTLDCGGLAVPSQYEMITTEQVEQPPVALK